MFAGMLLHDIESAVRIDLNFDRGSGFQWMIAKMQKPVILFVTGGNSSVTDYTRVAGLAAFIRKEYGSVKFNQKSFFAGSAGNDGGITRKKHAVKEI
jgi:hypothetical protein